MGYQTIIVGTDGSITAGTALLTAAGLAKRFRAGLRIVFAYEPSLMARPIAEQVLPRAQAAVKREGVEAEVELIEGEASEAIVQAAGRVRADLVVVGNKGIGPTRRFRLGGIPDQVAHAAPCDVLIVNTTDAPPSGEGHTYGTILVGTDGSPTAGEATSRAFELSVLLRSDAIVLVYVGDPIIGAIVLEETAAGEGAACEVRPRVVQGEPADMICRVSDEEKVDLIVVGNKGMTGARRVLLGSVPNKVAHEAPTDVLIARTTGWTLEDLEPGHGAVVSVEGRAVAAYRDETGSVHAVSPKCTHLGCTVGWNAADKTWDCPCHGSRYGIDGDVVRGPAEKRLAPVDLPSA